MVALISHIVGIALITFEYLDNRNSAGIHVDTLLSLLFIYEFLAIIFAVPYLLYLRALNKKA